MNHKSSNQKNIYLGLNIGSSSILLIFVLLCLICFATLAIVSANADSKLSRKVLDRTTAYYNACNEAEMALAELDYTLADAHAKSTDAQEYFSTVGHNKSYIIELSDLQALQVSVKIQYPETAEDTFYTVIGWQVIFTEEADNITE